MGQLIYPILKIIYIKYGIAAVIATVILAIVIPLIIITIKISKKVEELNKSYVYFDEEEEKNTLSNMQNEARRNNEINYKKSLHINNKLGRKIDI